MSVLQGRFLLCVGREIALLIVVHYQALCSIEFPVLPTCVVIVKIRCGVIVKIRCGIIVKIRCGVIVKIITSNLYHK